MDDLDDLNFAVRRNGEPDQNIIAFFEELDHAERFAKEITELDLEVLSRAEGDFYIDVSANITSSFDVRG